MPDLIQWHDDDKPAFAREVPASGRSADSRTPLEVPPELRAEMELPAGGQVATRADESILPKDYQDKVVGKSISLDAKVYKQTAARVFSAAVDAMTSLNIPVAAVDSPSGIVTSDWIRRGENNSGGIAEAIGLGSNMSTLTRHRFLVRVYRTKLETGDVTKLEVRVHGQAYINRHWVNKPLKRKISDELFASVDEQLTRMQRGASVNP